MPYLQLDTPFIYPAATKQKLARRFGEIYARHMGVDIGRVTVAIREVGEGGLWRCSEGDPRPAALLMCDIRAGRSPAQRAELARLLVDACKELVDLRDDNLNVEFTQHRGDEMYHPLYGGLSADWSPEEGNGSPARSGQE